MDENLVETLAEMMIERHVPHEERGKPWVVALRRAFIDEIGVAYLVGYAAGQRGNPKHITRPM